MPKTITEDNIEQGIIRLLTEPEIGYSHVCCMTAEPETLPDGSGRDNKKQVVLPVVLRQALGRLNPEIPASVLEPRRKRTCRQSKRVRYESRQLRLLYADSKRHRRRISAGRPSDPRKSPAD